MISTTAKPERIRLDRAIYALVPLALLAALLHRHSDFVHDDIFITLRYAVNLAETGLPQWNPGEWAEGYTSLVHVVLNGALIRLGVPPLAAAQGINLAAALALLGLTAHAARLVLADDADRMLRWLAVVAVAASPQVAIWVLGGLEAVVVAAFLMAGVTGLLSYLRQPSARALGAVALAFSLAVLTRLDAAVFIAGSGLGLLLATAAARPAGTGLRLSLLAPCVIVVGVPALVAFAQMGVRATVYGELFPLTFYAKVDLDFWGRMANGGEYLIRSLLFAPLVTVALLALGWAALRRRLSPAALLLAAPIGLHVGYVIWSGGDHMTTGRFIVILVAPAALALVALAEAQARRTAYAWIGLATGLTVALSLLLTPKGMDPAAKVGTIIGQHIEREWPRDITIALNTAGTTPFYASGGRRYIDMLGLNTPEIAKRENVPIITGWQLIPGHGKGDGAFVLAQAPDRIILGPAAGETTDQPWFLSDFELARLPEFFECYALQRDLVAIDPVLDARGEKLPNPLPFHWYLRTCP